MTDPYKAIKHNRSLAPNDPEFDEDLADISEEDYENGMIDRAEQRMDEMKEGY